MVIYKLKLKCERNDHTFRLIVILKQKGYIFYCCESLVTPQNKTVRIVVENQTFF